MPAGVLFHAGPGQPSCWYAECEDCRFVGPRRRGAVKAYTDAARHDAHAHPDEPPTSFRERLLGLLGLRAAA